MKLFKHLVRDIIPGASISTTINEEYPLSDLTMGIRATHKGAHIRKTIRFHKNKLSLCRKVSFNIEDPDSIDKIKLSLKYCFSSGRCLSCPYRSDRRNCEIANCIRAMPCSNCGNIHYWMVQSFIHHTTNIHLICKNCNKDHILRDAIIYNITTDIDPDNSVTTVEVSYKSATLPTRLSKMMPLSKMMHITLLNANLDSLKNPRYSTNVLNS